MVRDLPFLKIEKIPKTVWIATIKIPETKEEFYQKVEAIQPTKSRDVLVMVGDFNAKTGSSNTKFPENMG